MKTYLPSSKGISFSVLSTVSQDHPRQENTVQFTKMIQSKIEVETDLE